VGLSLPPERKRSSEDRAAAPARSISRRGSSRIGVGELAGAPGECDGAPSGFLRGRREEVEEE
jgi:hypothetical protein